MALVAGLAVLMAACSVSPDVESRQADGIDAGGEVGADGTETDSTETDGTETGGDGGAGAETSGNGGADASSSSLEWAPCEEQTPAVQLECATLVVPLDYSDPGGRTIDIAVARAATSRSSERIGSLVFNPGGPGGSGVDFLAQIPLLVGFDIQRAFDLVSFDPRGVGDSTAFTCGFDLDDDVPLIGDGDEAAWRALAAETAEELAQCGDSLDLLPYLGTVNAARDLDVLRAALGDEQLSYVGYSYGTKLGAAYAELFPERVRALVLDGALKPAADADDVSFEQAGGFDRAYGNFVSACDSDDDCSLRELGSADVVITELRAAVAADGPLSAGDRQLTAGELDVAIAAALYSAELWPLLADGLRDAVVDGDGQLLQSLADVYLAREPDGTYANQIEANIAINCADDPERPELDEIWESAEYIASGSVVFDDFLRANSGCHDVPESAAPMQWGPATGAPPILVIGTTGDPATPYEWAVELADYLDSGVLYSVDAEGHTAYGSVECVAPVVEEYLLELVVPDGDRSCAVPADEVDPFPEAGTGELDLFVALLDCLRDNGADIPPIDVNDLLVDPDSLVDVLDPTDPAFGQAVFACGDELDALS